MCENYSTLKGARYSLLLLSLEIGFRHIDPKEKYIEAKLIHTKHHQKLANIVFSSGDGEAIADLLHAWLSKSSSHTQYPQFEVCAEYLINLYLYSFSPRLRSHLIATIELLGYQQFEQGGAEGLIRLLNELQVCAGDLDSRFEWARLLLDVTKSSKGIQHLSHSYWELLVELTAYYADCLEASTYSPHTMVSLQEAKEWDKLICWISVVWMMWPPEGSGATEEDLENVILSLFHHQPGALQKLKEQMEQWGKYSWGKIPESFEQLCRQAHDKAARQAIL